MTIEQVKRELYAQTPEQASKMVLVPAGEIERLKAENEQLRQEMRETCTRIKPYTNLRQVIEQLRGKSCVYGGLIPFSECVHVQEALKRVSEVPE
jgi:hypothetical protein